MQLAGENLSDLRVLEGGWINKNSEGNNFRVTIKLCCSGRGCSLGIMATLINSHSSEWQAAFTASFEEQDQPLSETTLPEEPCPVPLREEQLFQADGQTDTPVSPAGLQTLRGCSRNNVHFSTPVAETDLKIKQGN